VVVLLLLLAFSCCSCVLCQALCEQALVHGTHPDVSGVLAEAAVTAHSPRLATLAQVIEV
jgi:hypothetical protein